MKKSLLASLCLTASFLLAACNGGKKDPPVEKNDGSLEKPFNVVEAIQECDDAGANTVVNYECYVTGTFEQGTEIDNYGRWSGVAKMDGKELHLNSLTVPETMKIAPENGRLDGKKFIVQGYLELHEGVYKLGYLPASVSPTNEKYNPVIYSIEGQTNYENMEGFKNDANKLLDKFVAKSNIAFPALPNDIEFEEGYIYPNAVSIGYNLSLYVEDDGTIADQLADLYEKANWISGNDDEEYTVEYYGYLYHDANSTYEVNIYFDDYYFETSFIITELKNIYTGQCCNLGSEDSEYHWFEDPDNAEYYADFTYADEIPVDLIAEKLGIPAEDVFTFETPMGIAYKYDEELGEFELDPIGFDSEAMFDDIYDNYEPFLASMWGDLTVFDTKHSYNFQVYSDFTYYYLYYYAIDTVCVTNMTTDQNWSEEDAALIKSYTGAFTLPFYAFGEDYEVVEGGEDDDYSFAIQDTYSVDMTTGFFYTLESRGFEQIIVPETEDSYGYVYYEKVCADGRIIDVEGGWAGGNYFYFYVDIPATEIILEDDMVELKPGSTYQIEYSFGPENSTTPEEEVTFSSDSDLITVSDKGLVTVPATATVADSAHIEVACGEMKATLLVTVDETGSSTETATDVIANSTASADMAYQDRTIVSATTGTEYTTHFYCPKGDSIMQFKSKNSCSGLVNTTSPGKVASITVDFEAEGNGLEVYASNSPITIADMYSGSLTKIGTITSSSATYTFTSDYAYFGIRSVSGAVKVNSISISWNI